MMDPETIEAVVQENSRNAAQNTPLRRAHKAVSASVMSVCTGLPPMCAPISSFHGSATQNASMLPTFMFATICGGGTTMVETSLSGSMTPAASQ